MGDEKRNESPEPTEEDRTAARGGEDAEVEGHLYARTDDGTSEEEGEDGLQAQGRAG